MHWRDQAFPKKILQNGLHVCFGEIMHLNHSIITRQASVLESTFYCIGEIKHFRKKYCKTGFKFALGRLCISIIASLQDRLQCWRAYSIVLERSSIVATKLLQNRLQVCFEEIKYFHHSIITWHVSILERTFDCF